MSERAAKPKPPKAFKQPPHPKTINARGLALQMLFAIYQRQQPLEEIWENNASSLRALKKRDQAFCRLLVLTVLRQKGSIDLLLNRFLPHRDRLTEKTQMVLRLGACQLLYLKTPPHAAISTSLDLLTGERANIKGVVNAVLRKLITEKPIAENLNWQHTLPLWLLQSWKNHFGEQLSQDIAKASLVEPTLDITVKSEPAKWAEKFGATLLAGGSLRLPHGTDVTKLEGFGAGDWWVQDCAARFPVQLAGAVAGLTVYDLCAAPGGKTAQLANLGGHVTAVERSEKRGLRLKENLQRLQLNAEIVIADAIDFAPTQQADCVLLDAPCTATGTIRRHPDIMILKSMDDVLRLAKTQKQLLQHAATLVKKGGTLIYAVCSLQPEEGPEQIDAFLAEHHKIWERVPVTPQELGNNDDTFLPFITKNGDLQTLPCHWGELGGMDGFYAARLKRKK